MALHNPARIQIRSILDTRKASGSGESGTGGLSSASFARLLRGDDSNGLDSEGVETLEAIDGAQLWGEVGQYYRMGKGRGVLVRAGRRSRLKTPLFR